MPCLRVTRFFAIFAADGMLLMRYAAMERAAT